MSRGTESFSDLLEAREAITAFRKGRDHLRRLYNPDQENVYYIIEELAARSTEVLDELDREISRRRNEMLGYR